MSALVQAQDLFLKNFDCAQGFDLCIERGQRWLLSGPSSSGKSSLVRTLLGLMSPRSGSVLLDGFNLWEITPSQLHAVRQGMGVVFSGGGLLPAWTGLENLMLPLRTIQGVDEEEAEATVLAFATQCRLPLAWLQRPAAQLSAEQSTLLSLARALILRPRLLWVDSELVWGVLSYAHTRLAVQLEEQVAAGCALVVCAGAAGVPAGQVPPCGPPTHRAHMQDGWLECLESSLNWTLETADVDQPQA